jgi:hypothetical protein
MRRAVLLVLVCACSGTDERPARLAYLQEAIFIPSCTTASCHSTLTRSAGLDLEQPDAAELRAELLFRSLIYPGFPQASPLVGFLRGGEGVPFRMPPDSPLPEADIQLVERWITDGAPE